MGAVRPRGRDHADVETEAGRIPPARALESLTFRALDYGPPPDEHWVIVGYRTKRGRKARSGTVAPAGPGKAATALEPGSRAALKQASDPSAEAVGRQKLVFAPNLWAVIMSGRHRDAGQGEDRRVAGYADAGRAGRPATQPQDRYLRIWSFDLDDDDAFIDE